MGFPAFVLPARRALPKAAAPAAGTALGDSGFTQLCTLCLRREAPQKRNNLLAFLWLGKFSWTFGQLLEEFCSEILKGLPAVYSPVLAASPGTEGSSLRTDRAYHPCPSTGELEDLALLGHCILCLVSTITPRPREVQGHLLNSPGSPFACMCQLKAIRVNMFYYVTLPGSTVDTRTGWTPHVVSPIAPRLSLGVDGPCLVLHPRRPMGIAVFLRYVLLMFSYSNEKELLAKGTAHDVSGAGPSAT